MYPVAIPSELGQMMYVIWSERFYGQDPRKPQSSDKFLFPVYLVAKVGLLSARYLSFLVKQHQVSMRSIYSSVDEQTQIENSDTAQMNRYQLVGRKTGKKYFEQNQIGATGTSRLGQSYKASHRRL